MDRQAIFCRRSRQCDATHATSFLPRVRGKTSQLSSLNRSSKSLKNCSVAQEEIRRDQACFQRLGPCSRIKYARWKLYLEVAHDPFCSPCSRSRSHNCNCLFKLRDNFCLSTDLLMLLWWRQQARPTWAASWCHGCQLWLGPVTKALEKGKEPNPGGRLHKERERSCGEEIVLIPCKSQEVPKPVINLMCCKCCMTNTGTSSSANPSWKFQTVRHLTHHPTSFRF